ncbi:Histone-lysine N-methyltransferase 2C [Nibea albiflora]|uniref:Histone-lysine N-methyltransferase 2C n=1 Tax=Nibea albiflora TaxID=240163 RepID=A0ACB7F5N6_NIBAL|nr:Histone-lysine N-methyltransferase 2C [Nibea albiflora]
MKAKMVALKGINKVMTQGSLGLNPMVINSEYPSCEDSTARPSLIQPMQNKALVSPADESQRRQYEEWLGETQRLLQMQQRLLEEQIAAHRKTKKSLSAKQRTAKKAGRPFADEDAAQLRHITEQQGTVQKQLEQIRKQQKDHAELIEDYRTKQQQQRALQQQPAAPPMIPAGAPPQPIVAMQPHPGGPTPACVPNVPPGWSPGGVAPGVIRQRMPLHLPPQMPPAPTQTRPHTQTPPAMVPGLAAQTVAFTAGPRGPAGGPNGAAGDGAAPRQQRLELEQQGLLGASMVPGAGVAAMPVSGAVSGARVRPGGPAASVPATGGDSLSQMPFFSSELPQDFLQSPPSSRPPPQHQGQVGAPFPQQAGLHQGFTGGPLHPGAHPAAAERPPVDLALSNLQTRPRFSGPVRPTRPAAQGQVQTVGIGAAGMTLSHPGGQAHQFGHDSSSSSPSFPCASSGGPASLIQLYSDIIPDDKPKKKRSRKRDGDDGGGGARTPLSSHSDDITAPPTPTVSDTSCSTPTRSSTDQSDLSFSLSSSLCGLAPSSELERQLSVTSVAQQRGSVLGMESVRGPLCAAGLEVKEEREEGGACGGGVVKTEDGGGEGFSSPSPLHGGGKDGDGGKELLRHLLKEKTSPATTPSPTHQAPPTAHRQLSNESIRSEEDDRPGSHGNMLSVLPLMEPVLGVDLSLFPPYGSCSLGRDSRLTGSFGNACLDGVTDYYSQLIYKQNNLSNPPTPPASLPPTPPPVARQKLVNGFATTEELSRKDLTEQDGKMMKT